MFPKTKKRLKWKNAEKESILQIILNAMTEIF